MTRWIPLIVFLAMVAGIVWWAVRNRDRIAILKEFFEFLRERKLWWISPIIIVLVLLGILIVAFETGALSSIMYVLF